MNQTTSPLHDLERRKRLDQVQPLLTAARTALRRLDFQVALARCSEALKQVPECAFAYEIKGDTHRARGEHDLAIDCFQRALALEPNNRRVQDKFALATLDMEETRLLEERRKEAAQNPQKFLRSQKNPLWSCVLSCVLPGFGQFYNEEYGKGWILVALFCFSSYFSIAAVWMMLQAMKGGHLSLELAQRPFQEMGVGRLLWILLNSLLSGAVWTYSVIEAPVTTLRENKRQAAEWGIA